MPAMLWNSLFPKESVLRTTPLFTLLCVMFAVAIVAFLTHALEKNPQFDTQGIRYGAEWVEAAEHDRVATWIMQAERKYPLLYVLPFAAFDALLALPYPNINETPMLLQHLSARFVTLLYALGTLWLLVLCARELHLNVRDALLLLFSSVLFFLFATAVRPHGAVTFWTLATYYLSLRFRAAPSFPRFFSACAAAACAFATLQSGIFAFFFPLWAVFSNRPTGKAVGIALGVTAGFLLLGTLVGYPFLFHTLRQGAGGPLDASLGHAVGFQFHPLLVPEKFWLLFSTETVLCTFAATGTLLLLRQPGKWSHPLLPLAVYCILFFAVFSGHSITASRFFLPLLPFMALMGAPAFASMPAVVRPALTLLLLLVYAQSAWLGFQQNTFERASAFVEDKPGYITASLPLYFFPTPPDRFIDSPDRVSEASFYILGKQQPLKNATLCATFRSSRIAHAFATNNSPFLWNEVQWPLVMIFDTRILGPSIFLYCT